MKQSQVKWFHSCRVVAILAILLATSVGIVGCKKATGGGKVTGLNGEEITVGFQMRCEDVADTAYLLGEVQFKDHGEGVAFRGVIDKSVLAIKELDFPVTCEKLDGALVSQGIFGILPAVGPVPFDIPPLGTYTPQPKTLGDGGDLFVMVLDEDNNVGPGLFPCPAGQDALYIQLRGGIYDGYAQGGCLDQGNLTVFEEY